MRQCGLVTATEGSYAKVSMKRHASCGSCNACNMGKEDKALEIRVKNDIEAQVGQWVAVDMEETDILSAALIVYGIPLLTLLGSVIFGFMLFNALGFVSAYRELVLAFFAFGATAGAFLYLRSREGRLASNKKYIPVIEEILEHES